MNKYEYKRLRCDDSQKIEKEINKVANDGWELVTAFYSRISDEEIYIFKRLKE